MELLTTVLLGLVSIVVGIGLLIYGIRGRRESQARDARTYKRGRI
jgi:O-antigen ligase